MELIQNYQVYTERMNKSLADKLFFIDFLKEHPKIKTFVDFGCADGQLLKIINDIFPYFRLVGIDNNREMIVRARENVRNGFFYSSISTPVAVMYDKNGKVLNLSSVLHEIFSYISREQILYIFDKINLDKYDYIFVRDMNYREIPSISSCSCIDVDKKVFELIDKKCGSLRKDFENYYHVDISQNKRAFIHFLLKYTYVENWNREMRENYFSFSIEQLINLLPNYELIQYEPFVLPFKKDQVLNDFGYEIKNPTHFKAILKLK